MLLCVGSNEILMNRGILQDNESLWYIVDTDTFKVKKVNELDLIKSLAMGEDIKNVKVAHNTYKEDYITGIREDFISCPREAECEDFIISVKTEKSNQSLRQPFKRFDLWYKGYYFKAEIVSSKEELRVNGESLVSTVFCHGLHDIAYGIADSLFFFKAGNMSITVKDSSCTANFRDEKDVGIHMKRSTFISKFL